MLPGTKSTAAAVCTCSVTLGPIREVDKVMSRCIDGICLVAENATVDVHSGDAIVFSPGEYELHSILSIKNMNDVTLNGSEAMINRTNIMCLDGGGLNFSDINNLSLSYLTFIGCGSGSNAAAIRLTNVTNFSMRGVTFLNSYNAALYGYAVTGVTLIVGSFFLGNYSGIILEKSHASLLSSSMKDTINGIQLRSAFLSLNDCQFMYGNTSIIITTENVGSLLESSSTLHVFNSTFSGCGFGIHTAESQLLLTVDKAKFNGCRFGIHATSVSTTAMVNDSTFSNCTYGLYLNLSTALCENCRFTSNQFGSLLADSSFVVANTEFSGNTVGLYAVNSAAHLNNTSFIDGKSHCVRAANTTINVTGNTSFRHCHSYSYGGALWLSLAVVRFVAPTTVTFANNKALLGGAVYVQPWLKLFTKEACFFEVDDRNGTLKNSVSLNFSQNHGHRGGSSLYADIRNCKLSDSGWQNYGLTNPESLLASISSGLSFGYNSTTRDISFEPIKVCICENGSISNCQQTVELEVYPGQRENVTIASIDLYGQIVPSLVYLGDDENPTIDYHIAGLGFTCYNFTLPRVSTKGYSDTPSTLYMSTGAALPTEGISAVTKITLKKRQCPLGFILKEEICDCVTFLTRKGVTCDIDTLSFTKPIDALETGWLGKMPSATSETTIGYSNDCPFEYCNGATAKTVRSDMFDEQCNSNRSGIMCGGCQENLSEDFGESECKACDNRYISLLAVFAIMGVALVAFHSLLDITVTSGTITGLVFYANVINIDTSLFFPPSVTKTQYGKFLYVFMSWMNLDFGFDVCFYDKMDRFGKTWLQFGFTVYVLAIVVAIILASRWCHSCAMLRKSSIIPVLATLILLSFTRTLNTVVSIFQYSDVSYVSNSSISVRRVWMYDGNIEYFDEKHALLFASAIVACAVFIAPYTLLMLCSPFLQKTSHLKLLCWVNKLKPFIDCYQAPYKDQYRYWTGILLSARILLSVVAVSTVVDRTIMVLTVNIASLILLIAFLGLGVYKRWQVLVLEGFLYANLNVMSLVLLYIDASRDESETFNKAEFKAKSTIAVITVGVGSAFVSFVGVVIYHVYLSVWKRFFRPAEKVAVSIEMNGLPTKTIQNELREPLMD